MSRYSRDDLRSMARDTLAAREAGDPRAALLVAVLSMRTGVAAPQCLQIIEKLAA
jgi:hypothetical protein